MGSNPHKRGSSWAEGSQGPDRDGEWYRRYARAARRRRKEEEYRRSRTARRLFRTFFHSFYGFLSRPT